jgi:hypothetical protein
MARRRACGGALNAVALLRFVVNTARAILSARVRNGK